MKKCVIIAAGRDFGIVPGISAEDLVIAADAGCNICKKYGIKPDLAVGDWDSTNEIPEGCRRIDLAVEKNDTDTLAAIRTGLEKGCTEFHIYCGTGGRTDHTLANLQCLVFLSKQGKKGYLYDEQAVVTAVTDAAVDFPADAQGDIGVFAADGTALGVTLQGLKYRLDNAKVTSEFPIGVSNSFTGTESRITVSRGTLYIAFPLTTFPT